MGRLRRMIPVSARRWFRRIVPKAERLAPRPTPSGLRLLPLVSDFPACEICGSGHRRALYVRKNYLALGCESCGVVETFPRPSDEKVAAYYESEEGWERNKAWPEGAELEEFLMRRRVPFRAEIDVLARSLSVPSATNGQAPKVLDFGCGIGLVLDIFAERGWITQGLEPAPRSAATAALRHVLVDEIPTEPTYDLIVAAHVFEHLPHPLETMKRLSGATVPGGQIYVGVPNFDRLPEHALFRHLLNEQHLFAYTFTAMSALLELGGYEKPRLLGGPEWDPIRDSVRSMRSLARKSARTVPALRSPRASGARRGEALEPAVRALAAYSETKLGQAYLTGGLRKMREVRAAMSPSELPPPGA